MLNFNVLLLNVFYIAPLVYPRVNRPRNLLKIELNQLQKQVNLALNALIGLYGPYVGQFHKFNFLLNLAGPKCSIVLHFGSIS